MGELYFDTENLFRGTVPRPGVPLDGVTSAQELIVAPSRPPGEKLTTALVAQAVSAIAEWHEPGKSSTIYSFGKRGDPSVRLFLGAIDLRNRAGDPSPRGKLSGRFVFDGEIDVVHQNVSREQHAGERALIATYESRLARNRGTVRVAVGSADHDALLAFDHSVLEGSRVDVVLPAQAMPVISQMAEDGRYQRLRPDRTVTVAELLARSRFRSARSLLLLKRRRYDADATDSLRLSSRAAAEVHHQITSILRVDFEGLRRHRLNTDGWRRALGEPWVHEAVITRAPDAASPQQLELFVARALSANVERALISRSIILHCLAAHPHLQPNDLRAYANQLGARPTYAWLPADVEAALGRHESTLGPL